MNILVVDTAGEPLSVALQAGEKVYSYHKKLARPHDETLLPAVNRLLKRAGLKADALTAIAAASGPGRFTGIRIGMAYAAVLAGALKKPAIALMRFEAVVHSASSDKACAVVTGFREEKFYQLFERKKGVLRPFSDPVWIGPAEWLVKRVEFARDGYAIAEGEPTAEGLLPAVRAALGRRIGKFEPLYLKPAGYENKARKPG